MLALVAVTGGRNAGFLLVKVAIKNSKNIGKDLELNIFVKATPPPPPMHLGSYTRGPIGQLR